MRDNDKKPTIYSVRNGFFYQDRFALLKFIEFLNKKEISEFYVDYNEGIPNQQSIDVYLKTKFKKNYFYEVKTGNNFYSDKKTYKNDQVFSEVQKAFKHMFDLDRQYKESSIEFAVPKNIYDNLSDYWNNINCLNNLDKTKKEKQQSLEWLQAKLNIPELNDLDKLNEFCNRITIKPSESDEICNEIDKFSDIEDKFINQANDLLDKFNDGICKNKLPTFYLMFHLLHECRKNAGTNLNCTKIFVRIVQEFITHRKMFDERKSDTLDIKNKKLLKTKEDWNNLGFYNIDENSEFGSRQETFYMAGEGGENP